MDITTIQLTTTPQPPPSLSVPPAVRLLQVIRDGETEELHRLLHDVTFTGSIAENPLQLHHVLHSVVLDSRDMEMFEILFHRLNDNHNHNDNNSSTVIQWCCNHTFEVFDRCIRDGAEDALERSAHEYLRIVMSTEQLSHIRCGVACQMLESFISRSVRRADCSCTEKELVVRSMQLFLQTFQQILVQHFLDVMEDDNHDRRAFTTEETQRATREANLRILFTVLDVLVSTTSIYLDPQLPYQNDNHEKDDDRLLLWSGVCFLPRNDIDGASQRFPQYQLLQCSTSDTVSLVQNGHSVSLMLRAAENGNFPLFRFLHEVYRFPFPPLTILRCMTRHVQQLFSPALLTDVSHMNRCHNVICQIIHYIHERAAVRGTCQIDFASDPETPPLAEVQKSYRRFSQVGMVDLNQLQEFQGCVFTLGCVTFTSAFWLVTSVSQSCAKFREAERLALATCTMWKRFIHSTLLESLAKWLAPAPFSVAVRTMVAPLMNNWIHLQNGVIAQTLLDCCCCCVGLENHPALEMDKWLTQSSNIHVIDVLMRKFPTQGLKFQLGLGLGFVSLQQQQQQQQHALSSSCYRWYWKLRERAVVRIASLAHVLLPFPISVLGGGGILGFAVPAIWDQRALDDEALHIFFQLLIEQGRNDRKKHRLPVFANPLYRLGYHGTSRTLRHSSRLAFPAVQIDSRAVRQKWRREVLSPLLFASGKSNTM
jgi:hypothetical protein